MYRKLAITGMIASLGFHSAPAGDATSGKGEPAKGASDLTPAGGEKAGAELKPRAVPSTGTTQEVKEKPELPESNQKAPGGDKAVVSEPEKGGESTPSSPASGGGDRDGSSSVQASGVGVSGSPRARVESGPSATPSRMPW